MEDLSKKISEELSKWQKSQSRQEDGYEYEKSFTELWLKLGKEVFQQSLGEESYDRNTKKK